MEMKKVVELACELMLGAYIHGYDKDKIFEIVMENDGIVCAENMAEYLIEHYDEITNPTE